MPAEKTTKYKDFIKDSAKIFACGDGKNRPAELMKQPAMRVLDGLNGTPTLYLEADSEKDKTIDVNVNKPKAGGVLESQTQSAKDFRALEKTLQELGNKTWIMDKDSILNQFVKEGSSKQDVFKKHMNKFKSDTNNEVRMGPQDEAYLQQQLMTDENNPFSMAVPSVSFEGNVGMINPADPDKQIHDMFFPYLKEDSKVGTDEYNKFINLHEAGHANDRRNHRQGMMEGAEDTVWKRHRTESVADTFATLMLAKETGNTEIGALATDVRNEFTVQGLAYISDHLAKQRQANDPDAMESISETASKLADFKDKSFEDKPYVGSPELKDYIEKQKNPDAMMDKQEPSYIEQMANRLGSAEVTKSGMGQSVEDVLGSIFAYTTTPTVDATLKVADKMLKDGSLEKMETKDIYSLSEKMVDENSYSKDQLTKMISSFVEGKETEEVKGILQRREDSGLEKAKGLVKGQSMGKEEKEAYDKEFAAKLGKDTTADKLVETVETEKDELRKVSPFRDEYKYVHAKIDHLNKKYIDGAKKVLGGEKEAPKPKKKAETKKKTAKIMAYKKQVKNNKAATNKVIEAAKAKSR